MTPSEEWLSVREAAAVLGVSQWTLRRRVARGSIRGYRAWGVAGMRTDQLVLSRKEIMRLLANPIQVS